MPLQIIHYDITKMRVDAIVNTTNEEMIGYSGVDLAVHTVAGEELDAECARLAPLGLGQAKITGGYNLPCKYVIHTSGPVWQGGKPQKWYYAVPFVLIWVAVIALIVVAFV